VALDVTPDEEYRDLLGHARRIYRQYVQREE